LVLIAARELDEPVESRRRVVIRLRPLRQKLRPHARPRAPLAAITKGIPLKAWLIKAITDKLEREEPGKPLRKR
jgi:hypothetical protein